MHNGYGHRIHTQLFPISGYWLCFIYVLLYFQCRSHSLTFPLQFYLGWEGRFGASQLTTF